jgi:hypothetical protein
MNLILTPVSVTRRGRVCDGSLRLSGRERGSKAASIFDLLETVAIADNPAVNPSAGRCTIT